MDWRITKISMKEGRKEKDVNLKLLSYRVMPRIPMILKRGRNCSRLSISLKQSNLGDIPLWNPEFDYGIKIQ